MEKNYFLGLDVGSNSVGYAVTDTSENYCILKHKGTPMWGVTLFDEAVSKSEQRSFRVARRRLLRRRQRINLLQEIFAPEIMKVDEQFYQRIKENGLLQEDRTEPTRIFAGRGVTDSEYHRSFPTIHHLICELMQNTDYHDIRLVYLACAWLLKHRGHFLSEFSEDNISSVTSFSDKYYDLMRCLEDFSLEVEYSAPWDTPDLDKLAQILKERTLKSVKEKNLIAILCGDNKHLKFLDSSRNFPFSIKGIIRLLSGGSVALKDLYYNEDYEERNPFSLDMPEEEYEAIMADLGDDSELLLKLRAIYDWAVLCDLLDNHQYISQAKVAAYQKHASDLRFLKYIIKKYIPGSYNNVFRRVSSDANYVSYSSHLKSAEGDMSKYKNKAAKGEFCKYIKGIVGNIDIQDEDKERYADMCQRLDQSILTFMPKQVEGDNRAIPYQLYYVELENILDNASKYFPFLLKKDTDGYSAKEKILSIMKFRIPYYVGPLNSQEHGWMIRKAEGRIYPWNFMEKVDLDKSEQEFIRRMTKTCTYLPGEDVLPKHSLLYEKFEVLNEINNLKICNNRIPVNIKQAIFNDLFLKKKKVTPKMIKTLLVANNYCSKDDADTLSGIDETIKSSLASHIAFAGFLKTGSLTENDVESIIERSTYSEKNTTRFKHWLQLNYSSLSGDEQKYICSLSFNNFGRLSRKLLCELEGADKQTGEITTIIKLLWETNDNLSEILLSDNKYTFQETICDFTNDYYLSASQKLDDRFDEMYVSTAMRRPIIRALDVVHDIVKATGHVPEKIFIEMARDLTTTKKGKRTKSRREQLLNLYQKIAAEDAKSLSKELEQKSDSELQSNKLFLYYMQLGKCMYSGQPIDIEKLKDGTYDIDHIYPKSKVSDDSILNNKVLVLSQYNSDKKDQYPVPDEWRHKMYTFWTYLRDQGLITKEKFNRLTRNKPFTDDEKWGFISRQLAVTRRSTKVISTLLQGKYADAEIVYIKAGLVAEFRHNYNLEKSRAVNDLHHAKDAYLNIVCGNVYNEHFTKKWFLQHKNNYTVNSQVLYGNDIYTNGRCIWHGGTSLSAVKNTMSKNIIHMTPYAFCRHGGLFKQKPVKAKVDLVPRKKGLQSEKYGGYKEPAVTFFMLTQYKTSFKREVMLVPIELMQAQKFMADRDFALQYIKERISSITGKTVGEMDFPLGMRPIKIKTLFSLDGFICSLSSANDNGKRVVVSPFMPLILPIETEQYIKRLEVFCEKCKKYKNYLFSSEYDKISKAQNVSLYESLLKKYRETIYAKRPNNPSQLLAAGYDIFKQLNIETQAETLLNIVATFGRVSQGCNLEAIGGKKNTAAPRISAFLSNWKKNYKTAYIIDQSSSGIWQKKSGNLLELL